MMTNGLHPNDSGHRRERGGDKMLTSFKVLLDFLVVALLFSCSSVDCPLNNIVYANYKLEGPVQSLPDTLTISAQRQDGTDTILLNKSVPTDSFSLPVSYGQPVDVLFFETKSTTTTLHDTVWVEKTNFPHFESTDCGVNYFHVINNVRFTRHALDSIVINNNSVTYDVTPKHFYVYFKEYRL
jgi:hypothetical protein